MARPRKTGLDYFPLDVDFFDDEKIVAISGEFGLKGELVAVKLLCAVYRNGYFIEWSDMLKMKMLRSLPGVSVELLDQILNRLVRWDFFDRSLFDSVKILTSRGVQKRYFNSVKKRLPDNEYPNLLIPVTYNNVVQPSKKRPKDKPLQKEQPLPKDGIAQEIEQMKGDASWTEPVCMRYRLKAEELPKWLDNFASHCLCSGKTQHEDISDAKRHFCQWLNMQQQRISNNQQPTIPPSQADYEYNGGFGGKDI